MSVIISCVLLVLSYNAVVVAIGLVRSSAVIKASSRFTRVQENARHHVLVVGDSTAVGTGANSPEDSIAGRIAAEFGEAAIHNFARDGAQTEALQQQFTQAPNGPYDMVLIQIGGNDALRFTGRKSLQDSINASLTTATGLSKHVVLVGIGDLGEAPSIPWPLSSLYSYRSAIVREILRKAAKIHGAHFLDLMAVSDEEDSFRENPDKYYARDGLHPSSAGYKLWYLNLRESITIDQWLDHAR